MEVILLERVAKLGQMGDVVRVKDGFARNFLLPQGKALRATADNKSKFETMKVDLQARNSRRQGRSRQDRQPSSTARASWCFVRRRETGQLFGSVSPRDHRGAAQRRRLCRRPQSDRAQRADQDPSACTRCRCMLHPEVEVTITVNVARSADEAERLARGEDVTVRREEGDDAEADAAAVKAVAEKFFEPAAVSAHQENEGGAEPAEKSSVNKP